MAEYIGGFMQGVIMIGFIIGNIAVFLFLIDGISYYFTKIVKQEIPIYHKMFRFKDLNGKIQYGVANIDDEDGVRIDYNNVGRNKYDHQWFSYNEIVKSLKNGDMKIIHPIFKPVTYLRNVG